jgi:hypothetical protein
VEIISKRNRSIIKCVSAFAAVFSLLSLASCKKTEETFYKDDLLKGKYDPISFEYTKDDSHVEKNSSYILVDDKVIDVEYRNIERKVVLVLNNKWEKDIVGNTQLVRKDSFAYFENYLFLYFQGVIYKFDNEINLLDSKVLTINDDVFNPVSSLFIIDAKLTAFRFSSVAKTSTITTNVLEDVDQLTFTETVIYSHNNYLYSPEGKTIYPLHDFIYTYDTPVILDLPNVIYILVDGMLFKKSEGTWRFLANRVLKMEYTDDIVYYSCDSFENKIRLLKNEGTRIETIYETEGRNIFATPHYYYSIVRFSKQLSTRELVKSSILVTDALGVTKHFSFFEQTIYSDYSFSENELSFYFNTHDGTKENAGFYKVNLPL